MGRTEKKWGLQGCKVAQNEIQFIFLKNQISVIYTNFEIIYTEIICFNAHIQIFFENFVV